MTDPKKIDPKIIKALTNRFVLTLEQAEFIYNAYLFGGSCEEAVEAIYAMDDPKLYGIGPEIIRQVLAALHDLFHNPEYRKEPPE